MATDRRLTIGIWLGMAVAVALLIFGWWRLANRPPTGDGASGLWSLFAGTKEELSKPFKD